MKKILVVSDSTSALSLNEAEKCGIILVPLSVILDGKHYKDHIEMSQERLYDELRLGKVPTTSQPSVGEIEELMESWKLENYDAIIILTCSAGLSGTYQSFNMAKESVGLENVYLIDTRSVAAPICDMARETKKMSDNDCEIGDILAMIKRKCNGTFSFLYPESLEQLKKGGRISPVAAKMASLLKIKALLYLADHGNVVDKYAMARTEQKIFEGAVDKFISEKVDTATHKIYVLHADNITRAMKFVEYIQLRITGIECEILNLPAVLTCHGGLGCIAMQSTIK